LPKIQANFASSARTDMNVNKGMLFSPGPQDYIPDLSKSLYNMKDGGDRKPFGVNTIRFGKDDNGVPGAGTYKLPDSCQVRQPKQELASYRSKV
jgi:hypothetical protein